MRDASVAVYIVGLLLAAAAGCHGDTTHIDDVWLRFGDPEPDQDYQYYDVEDTNFIPTSVDGSFGKETNTGHGGVDTSEEDELQPEANPLPLDPESSSVEKLSEKVDQLLSNLKAHDDKISELEEANRKLVLKIDSIEQQTKTNSIIIANVPQSPNENSRTTLHRVLHVLNRILKVRASERDIAVALRAESNDSGNLENYPIVVRFTNFATKMKVLGASNRLSHTNIKISSDYSELVAKRRAELVPYLTEARAQGHKAFILYDKLMVDGVKWSLEELRAEEARSTESNNPDDQVEQFKMIERLESSYL